MAPLCVPWNHLKYVPLHALCRDVYYKCHSAKEGSGAHINDTEPNPGGSSQGP